MFHQLSQHMLLEYLWKEPKVHISILCFEKRLLS